MSVLPSWVPPARLAAFVDDLTSLLAALPPAYSAGLSVDRDGTRHYTCDGGTAIAAYVAAQHGLDADIRIGLYWHGDAARLAALRGDDLDELHMSAEEYADTYGLDEHHHWLELTVDSVTVVYDPNGAVRGEPTLQILDARARSRYAPLPDSDPWSRPVFDRHDDPLGVIADLYPDALACLGARWPRAGARARVVRTAGRASRPGRASRAQ